MVNEPCLKEPQKIIINGIKVLSYPELYENSQEYDKDGTKPDLRFFLRTTSGETVFESETYDNYNLEDNINFLGEIMITIDSIEHSYIWDLKDIDTGPLPGFTEPNRVGKGNLFFYQYYYCSEMIETTREVKILFDTEYVY